MQSKEKVAGLKDRLIFFSAIKFLQLIFTIAITKNRRLEKAVSSNPKVRYIFRYRDLSDSILFNRSALGTEAIYEIEFVRLREALVAMLENPKNILELMISGCVKTDSHKNPFYLFLLGHYFSRAEPFMKETEPAVIALLDIMGISRVQTKKTEFPRLNKKWEVPDLNGYSLVRGLALEMSNTRPHVSIENAKFITEYFEGASEKIPITERWANAIKYSNGQRTLRLNNGPIIGSIGEYQISTAVFPWLLGFNILPDLVTLNEREKDPTYISEEQIEILVNDIFPYWAENNPYVWAKKQAVHNGNHKSFRLSEMLSLYMLSLTQMASHLIPNYKMILDRGLLDMIFEAKQRQQNAESKNDQEKISFFRSQIIALEGVLLLAERYAAECERQSATMKSRARKKELLQIAKCLRNSPAHAAANLHEALLAINMLRVAINQESFCSGLSIGRLDMLIEPYLQDDLASGRITRKRAYDLIGAFLVRLNDVMPLVPDSATIILGGTPTNQAVTVGPKLLESTQMILRATAEMNLLEPNLCVRVGSGADEETTSLIKAAIEVVGKTGASLAFYGDKATIPILQESGLSKEDAENYGIVGCVEPTGHGDTYGHTGSIMFNAAKLIEITVNGGSNIGRETPRLSECESFEEFYAHFSTQLAHIVRNSGIGNFWLWKGHQKMCPTPLLSAFIMGSWEAGRDVTLGGAKYNSSGVTLIGVVNVVDSLMAIKKLVYEEKRITPRELENALRTNFQTSEGKKIRALLLNKAPKFGKDEEAAQMMVMVEELFEKAFATNIGPRGEGHKIGNWSMSFHAAAGNWTAATPDGRFAGSHLTSGATPSSEGTKTGMLSILNATSLIKAANGIAVNLFTDHESLMDNRMVEILITYFTRLSGMQVQITAHSRATLLDAMKHPENHSSIVVRVSGYNAYFVQLAPDVQLEMIERLT